MNSMEDVTSQARDAGSRLVHDLTEAARLSSNWHDEPLGYALLATAMDRCLSRLAATGCWGKANQLASSEFWSIAGPLLDVGWLQPRARHKPRGYAGDYEMFVRFWQHTCDDRPPACLFDRYFQAQAAVEAVRSRTRWLAAAIVAQAISHDDHQPFHVVSVGCGPAIEIELAADCLPAARRNRLQVTLLDFDPDALDHARERLAGVLRDEQLVTLRDNLHRLPERPRAADSLPEADLLYCPGLFDYLPDETAEAMLRFFWRRLGERGRMLVGNFAPHNPTRAYMEWIGNWYLIYRTTGDLAALATAAGLPEGSFAVIAEPLGIDLFLEAWRG